MAELIFSTILVPVNDKLIGLQLKKARMESGLSQEEVGNRLGVTWEMISRYENGRSSALKHLRKLAEIYEKPLNYFMVESGDDKQESFSITELVQKLKESGVSYSKSVRNVVKLLDKLSGKGIDFDLEKSENFVEAKTSLTDQFPTLFAMRMAAFELKPELGLNPDDIGYFAAEVDPADGDIVISYDGINYELNKYASDSINASLAVLVSLERKFRS
jgi:transcriptional regulator with XRE-family HTH domain